MEMQQPRPTPSATMPVAATASQPQSSLSTVIEGITSSSHLDRTRSHADLLHSLPFYSPSDLESLEMLLISHSQADQKWESIHGSLQASHTLLSKFRPSPSFVTHLESICEEHITHPEPRVREAASDNIAALATIDANHAWATFAPKLLEHVQTNFFRDEEARLKDASRFVAREIGENARDAKAGLKMVHETEGWRGLETSLLALSKLFGECGTAVFAAVDNASEIDGYDDMMDFVCRARLHPNRFVREAGLKLLTSVILAACELMNRTDFLVRDVTRRCLEVISAGLQDNWSQVRFSACVAARASLGGLRGNQKAEFYDVLLPRMCLNRHYVAEGVRNYSQTSWRTVVGADGRVFLERKLSVFVTFYESQCRADNHAVREAACQSLGEAAIRLDRHVVESVVGRIIDGLIVCFKDESWPVRDHACRALADVISVFGRAAESHGVLEDVFELFRAHLSDNIPSVRSNCAEGLVRAAEAYNDSHSVIGLRRIADTVRELLKKIAEQKEGIGADQISDTQYGASTKLAGNDAAHTDQVMYSCGSLAPKLRRGGGCSDHGFVRPKEAWEECEGGVLVWKFMMRFERGMNAGSGLVGDVVKAGTIGSTKVFRGKSRFLQGLLEAVSGAIASCGDISEETLKGIAVLLQRAESEGGVAKSCAKESCRKIRAVVGLRRFAAAEAAVKNES